MVDFGMDLQQCIDMFEKPVSFVPFFLWKHFIYF